MKIKPFLQKLLLNAGLFFLPLLICLGIDWINYGGLLHGLSASTKFYTILFMPVGLLLICLAISYPLDYLKSLFYGSIIPVIYTAGIKGWFIAQKSYFTLARIAPSSTESMAMKWVKIQKMIIVIPTLDVWGFGACLICIAICTNSVIFMWKKIGKADLFKGDHKKQLEQGPWQSGYMDKDKVKYLTTNKKGVALGIVPQEYGLGKDKIARFPDKPVEDWIGGHHLVMSATRGGKGVSCVLPTLLDHDGPVAVIDIKGELMMMTRRYRASLGRKIVCLNLFDAFEENTAYWNPLEYIRPNKFDRDVTVIIDGLVEKGEGDTAKHFGETVKDIIREGIFYLRNHKADSFHLPGLYDLFFEKELEETLKEWVEDKSSEFKRLASIARTVLGMGTNEKGSFKSTLLRAVGWIRFDECKKFLTKSSFSIDEILDNQVDLYCVMSVDMVEAMDRFMRLFTNIMLTTMIRREGRISKNVLLMLDEFTSIGRLPNLLQMMTQGAGYGLEMFLATQNRSTTEEVWGKSTSTIISNTTVRVFNLGRLDEETSSSIVKVLGKKTIVTQSKSSNEGDKSKNEGESFSQTSEKLMDESDILEMETKNILCLLRSQKPLILERIISHTHPDYKDKLDEAPLKLK